jgi:hypothetical protein
MGACLLASSLASPARAEDAASQVAEAASGFLPGVEWRASSVLEGDFTCRGRVEHAILGVNDRDVVVAIFAEGLERPPEVLGRSRDVHDPDVAVLALEDMDFEPREFEDQVGYVPDGMRPSKTCKGLNLGGGNVDSLHVYWDHDARNFSAWSF